jgi:hypothetical protein
MVRRSLWRLVWWRFFGDVISLPRRLLNAVVLWLVDIERCFFYLELDAARTYKLLTGIDPAHGTGERVRYAGTAPGRAARDQATVFGEEDDDEESPA